MERKAIENKKLLKRVELGRRVNTTNIDFGIAVSGNRYAILHEENNAWKATNHLRLSRPLVTCWDRLWKSSAMLVPITDWNAWRSDSFRASGSECPG